MVKSSPIAYDVHCVRSECSFRVYASKGKWEDFWEVRKVVEQTCLLEQLEQQHRNLSAGFIANYMYPLIVDNPSYEPKSCCRLRASGLLPFARLVEGDLADSARRPRDKATRFQFDMSLLLSVETHRRAATGNTKSREVAGALAGTAPSSTAHNSSTRRGL